MAHEIWASNSGALSYVCCEQNSHSHAFQRAYAFNRPAGYGQVFSSLPNDVRFPLSLMSEQRFYCSCKTRTYPIVIVCREINDDSVVPGNTTVATTAASSPTFDQYHIVQATIRVLRSAEANAPVTPDRVSVLLLSQKHVYNGIVFKLFELYGAENQPAKPPSSDQPARKKNSLVQVVATTMINEREPFLSRYALNRDCRSLDVIASFLARMRLTS